jgi:hypothetical protein
MGEFEIPGGRATLPGAAPRLLGAGGTPLDDDRAR